MNDFSPSEASLPTWADADFSRQLPTIAAIGEQQNVEFKERLPAQVRDLAKEIAAFATSNAGTILLGITDSGEIVGLSDCQTQDGRAQLIQRLEGLCANIIRPTTTPSFRFGVIENHVVLALQVPKGDAPLYYVGNVPYLRQLTAARPAEPFEVIDLVLAWHRARNPESSESPTAAFVSRVAILVNDVLVHACELTDRQVNPWLDECRSTLAFLAQTSRDLAANPPEDCSDLSPSLEALSAALDRVAHQRLTLNSGWSEMEAAASAATEQAQEIRKRWVDTTRIDPESIAGVRDVVRTTQRKLTGLASRLEEMDDQNRLDEARSEAANYGLFLLKAATFGVGLGAPPRLAELLKIGRQLREIETRQIYMDGGQSVRKIMEDIRDASERLTKWLVDLE
ncbi:MAG: Aaa-4 family protein [Rhodospirillaceae bacterium]|nr:MAG: Aaa-4 family protein [Rhodospirillaceae bacterium]